VVNAGTGSDTIIAGGGSVSITKADATTYIDFSNTPVPLPSLREPATRSSAHTSATRSFVDSTSGLQTGAPISFQGNGDRILLILKQSGGPTQTSDTYTVGPNRVQVPMSS